MSLTDTVTQAVEGTVREFAKLISKHYGPEVEELMKIWRGENPDLKPVRPSVGAPQPKEKQNEMSENVLKNMTKAELVELCKQKQVKHTGTKPVLIAALTGGQLTAPSEKAETSKKATGAAVKAPPVVKKNITADVLRIRRNNWGNFEHAESSLVFNNKNNKVIGKQLDDGNVAKLTDEDIETCNKFKFDYELPDNLDKDTGLDEVEVEELDSDEEEVEFEEEELLEEDDEFDEEIDEEEEEEFEYEED